ncbi:MAG: hypothetical protein LHV69_07975, partial [Elusimicrobia bacterium]|nr:hypothetical protein [Candidatus Obscuribacterium magneticum]
MPSTTPINYTPEARREPSLKEPPKRKRKVTFVSENQRRVIQDKFLKEAPSVEAWLAGVARNVALAELLYHPSAYQWGLFDGVRVSIKEFDFSAELGPLFPKTKMWLLHAGLPSAHEREVNFSRFLRNCAAVV